MPRKGYGILLGQEVNARYPSKILGFVGFTKPGISGGSARFILCSSDTDNAITGV